MVLCHGSPNPPGTAVHFSWKENNSGEVNADLHVLLAWAKRAQAAFSGEEAWAPQPGCLGSGSNRHVPILCCWEVYFTLDYKMGVIMYLFWRVVVTSELLHLHPWNRAWPG